MSLNSCMDRKTKGEKICLQFMSLLNRCDEEPPISGATHPWIAELMDRWMDCWIKGWVTIDEMDWWVNSWIVNGQIRDGYCKVKGGTSF